MLRKEYISRTSAAMCANGTTTQCCVDDLKIYQLFEDEQIILPQLACCVSVKVLLRMCGLKFKVEMCANAESMSPTGYIPFLKCGSFVVAGMDSIIDFLHSKEISLNSHLPKDEKADMKAYMSLIKIVLTNAQLFLSWCDKTTYLMITKPKSLAFLPWPVGHFLCMEKKSEIRNRLNAVDWRSKNKHDVYEEVNNCCHSLSEKLGEQNFMFGDKPTELDALVFGHLYAILNTSLPDNKLSAIVREYSNLMDFCCRIDTQYFQNKMEEEVDAADMDN